MLVVALTKDRRAQVFTFGNVTQAQAMKTVCHAVGVDTLTRVLVSGAVERRCADARRVN